MSVVAKIHEGDGDPRHGTQNGYGNLGCRCGECREAHRVYDLEVKHRRGYSLPRDVWLRLNRGTSAAHGTETRYVAGCRCGQCRRAANEERWRRRHVDLEAARKYDREYKRRRRAALAGGHDTP